MGTRDVPMIDGSVLLELHAELARARRKFPRKQASAHEGFAVLLEEVDELWDAIKANEGKERLRAEAVQVAAMAIRFLEEVCA